MLLLVQLIMITNDVNNKLYIMGKAIWDADDFNVIYLNDWLRFWCYLLRFLILFTDVTNITNFILTLLTGFHFDITTFL